MELIPILSFIILVATISTFILAFGAYILYKIRERKGRVSEAPEPEKIEGELITPVPIATQPGVEEADKGKVYYKEVYQPKRKKSNSKKIINYGIYWN